MKRNRIIFLILWLLSLAGITCFGGPVSYGLFWMFTLIPAVSLLYLLLVWMFFRIYQELGSKFPVADHTVPYFFTLVNEYHFGYAGIRVRLFSSFSTITGLDDGVEYELLPQTGIKKQTQIVCRYRGEYEVGIKRVEITDFFRLFRLTYNNKETLRVTVKPDAVALEELRTADISRLTSRESTQHPAMQDVLVREYAPGDDVRRMNWRISAAQGRLMVRGETGEEKEGIGILFSTCRRSAAQADYLPAENKVLEIVLALALFFAGRGIPSDTLYLAAEGMPELPLSGLDGFEAYYDRIGDVQFREEWTEEQLVTEASGDGRLLGMKAVFLVLQEWTPQAARLVQLFNENKVAAIAYVVGADRDLRCAEVTGTDAAVYGIPTDADLKEVL